MPNDDDSMEASFGVSELPPQVLETYAHLWQFETWLRRLVYVQLRALDGDAWESKINAAKAKLPKDNDKRMTHMPTPEDDVLSFIQLSELKRVISDHWKLFESYMPPKTIWDAKLEEVLAIRHRVAHFRSLHRDDLPRVVQFLRDIDGGFWRFCTSYNNPNPVLPQSSDPVVEHFLPLDIIPWRQASDGTWARIGSTDPSERFTVTVEVLAMPWAEWKVPIVGREGFLYDVTIYARGQRHLDYHRLMRSTTKLHDHVVHICLDGAARQFRFTVPACLGAARIIPIVEGFDHAARNSLAPGARDALDGTVQAFADAQPEYVLGPLNPLSFLSRDMPCALFQGISKNG
ncbi:hypothetical protein PCO31111_04601 [Pandoraea communis]|uniref:SAV2148-like HEPN domain-containing protein n=1 Tax=Pandoraea communis TaxID=2508297 RepID=A0A5E4YK84_9BURK|nr:SAV2148 family HEPN domain-containing protein [Pandoraea communis]VVE48932.1 hypothetical protein PCO31111_04601 [Pandoraea communis]